MYDLGCMLVESRSFMVIDGLPGLYGIKYDSVTACGLPLYLCSYKLDVLLQLASEQDSTLIAICVFKTKVFVFPKPVLATLGV